MPRKDTTLLLFLSLAAWSKAVFALPLGAEVSVVNVNRRTSISPFSERSLWNSIFSGHTHNDASSQGSSLLDTTVQDIKDGSGQLAGIVAQAIQQLTNGGNSVDSPSLRALVLISQALAKSEEDQKAKKQAQEFLKEFEARARKNAQSKNETKAANGRQALSALDAARAPKDLSDPQSMESVIAAKQSSPKNLDPTYEAANSQSVDDSPPSSQYDVSEPPSLDIIPPAGQTEGPSSLHTYGAKITDPIDEATHLLQYAGPSMKPDVEDYQ